MLKKRVIPVLLLKDSRMVKGKQFNNFRDVGNPISCARVYNSQDCDEMVLLDIDASKEQRKTFFHTIEKIARECFMPLTIGGGIKTIQDIQDLLNAGADKVLITSEATINLQFLNEASIIFGSQCIVCGVDVKRVNNSYNIYSNSATVKTDLDFCKYLESIQLANAGEIFINSIDRDGEMLGYDIELLDKAVKTSKLPIIFCGGAGNYTHLLVALKNGASAVACGSLFHFGDNNPLRAKAYLQSNSIDLKRV